MACCLPFRGPCLRPDPGILRLGAFTCWPLIMIRGPNFSHPLDMILSSAAMVSSWAGEAWLTSIVNFFIGWLLSSQVARLLSLSSYLFLLVAGSLLERPRFFLVVLFPCYSFHNFILSSQGPAVKLAAWSLELFSFFSGQALRSLLSQF